MEIFSVLKTGGFLGFLFGIFFVTWISPGTTEGFVLLLLICVAAGTTLWVLGVAIVGHLRAPPDKPFKFTSRRGKPK
ncbi:MAG: hypothetical protein AAGI03_15175 [Pseudomonadota bacterium]